MKKQLDHWSFYKEKELNDQKLARLLIALDELRDRLDIEKYPKLDISDDGFLFFKMSSEEGVWEIFALLEGLDGLADPGLAISFPFNPRYISEEFVEIVDEAIESFNDIILFAVVEDQDRVLEDYENDVVPDLPLIQGKDNIIKKRKDIDHFTFFGIYLPVKNFDLVTVETLIIELISRIEDKGDLLNSICKEKS